MRLVMAGLLIAVALSAPAAAAAASPARDRLDGARTFALALGDGAAGRDLAGYDVVVVDGTGVSARRVAELQGGGALVLGYLSVGTIERGRPWTSAAAPYRLERWADWGEWFADVARPGFRRLVLDSMAPRVLARGFDGLFLDNVDMTAEHPRQRRGMRALVRALSARVHARGGVVMAQNGDGELWPLRRALDGWNREDVTYTYDFGPRRYVRVGAADHAAALRWLRRFASAGLRVTATDYVAAAGAGRRAARAASIACAAGALSYVSDIGLRRVPAPVACAG